MDDLNPFDQFGKDLNASLPPQPAPAAAPTLAPPSPSPAQPPKPVMNQSGSMYGNMYNQPPYGGPPPPGPPQYGMPPPPMGMPPPMGYGMPPGPPGPPPPTGPPSMGPPPGQSMNGSMNGSMSSLRMSGGAAFGNSFQAPPYQAPPPTPPTVENTWNQSPKPPPPSMSMSMGHSQSIGAIVPSNTQSNPYALGASHPNLSPYPTPQQWNPANSMPPPPQYGAPPPGAPSLQSSMPPMPPPPGTRQGSFSLPTGPPPQPVQLPDQPPMPPQPMPPQPMPSQPVPQPPAQPALNASAGGNMWDDFLAPGQPLGSSQTSQPPAPVPPPVPVPQQPQPPQYQADMNIFGASTSSLPAAPVPPAPAAPVDDPWGSSFTAPAPQPANALVVSNTPNDDPFGIFGGSAPAPVVAPPAALVAAPAPQQAIVPAENDDMWSSMGFDAPVSDSQPIPKETLAPPPEPEKKKEGQLPPGGEWYDARIFTPTLGVMFFKPQELTDSLFLQTDPSVVQDLQERPVVAFIVEGSSARSAGVELGHVLLKVNGIDVKNPKEASRLIKEGPRPLPLLFYVPDTQIVVAEGEHMVKYDTRETGAPPSAKDWKPKYVVIGGIIAQPWMMNMYRSKSEYDIAVIETQARRPVSVKVKQFSLQGARIQNDWQGPQMVKYKNKLHPWKYIVVLPVARNPIKISSPNLSQLKPVHEGVRRVLLAQQRGSGGPTAGPVRNADAYKGDRKSVV